MDIVLNKEKDQYLPAKGMTRLIQIISKVKKYINPDIKIDNMFFTLVDSRTKSTMEALKSNFGNQIRMYRTLFTFFVSS